ncbi:MAG TPA: hypothetical protein VFU14_20205 [Acidimicrobiales bacterium]|nr:hypothetical protein [Acidimicrobiales bacterium]
MTHRPFDHPTRTEAYAFVVVDDEGNAGGRVTPQEGVTISCSSTSPVARHIPSMVLPPSEVRDLNPDVDRIQVWVNINGGEYPLGVYAITTPTAHVRHGRRWREMQLHDLGVLLSGDDTLPEAFGVASGDRVTDAIEVLLDRAGVARRDVVATLQTAGNHLAWPPTVQPATPMRALTALAGLTFPWFDVDGVCQVGWLPYAGLAAPRYDFSLGKAAVVDVGDLSETDDRWGIPTEWRVRSKAQNGALISALYQLPSSHPMSSAARGGRRRQRDVPIPGLESTDDAKARARDAAQRETAVHRTRSFRARLIPTLEPHDVVTYVDGTPMLLDQWTVTCVPGALMDVTLRESLIEESSLS